MFKDTKKETAEDWFSINEELETLEEDIEVVGVYKLIETKKFKNPKIKVLEVVVTRKHCNGADYTDPNNCGLARAIKEQYGRLFDISPGSGYDDNNDVFRIVPRFGACEFDHVLNTGIPFKCYLIWGT